MIVLGLDCGGTESQVAITRDGILLTELTEPADRGALIKAAPKRSGGDRFVPLIEQAMHQVCINIKDVDLIAACTGPGSFTGIRIGLAAADGLSFALNKPLVGFDAFALCHHAEKNGDDIIVVVIESKREELYVQAYDANGTIILPAQSMMPDAIQSYLQTIDKFILYGDAAQKIVNAARPARNTASLAAIQASQLSAAQHAQFPAAAFYVRPADAMPQAVVK